MRRENVGKSHIYVCNTLKNDGYCKPELKYLLLWLSADDLTNVGCVSTFGANDLQLAEGGQ